MMKERQSRAASERRGERGSVLILSVVGLSAFFLMAGLAIDITHFYLVKTELQNTADAASLAAASALNSTNNGIDLAVRRAVRVVNENKYDFNKKSFIGSSDLNTLLSTGSCNTATCKMTIRFLINIDNTGMDMATAMAGNAASIKFVRVELETPANTPVSVFFGRSNPETGAVILGASKTIPATATAGWSVPSNQYCDLAPFSVTECDDPNSPTCRLGETQGVTYIPIRTSDGTANCSSQTVLTPGCKYLIKGVSGSSVAPGNYQLLALTGPGGGDVRFAAAGSVDTCIPVSDMRFRTKTGTVTGPVRQGINTRFGEWQGGGQGFDAQNYPPDTNIYDANGAGITYQQYVNAVPPPPADNPGAGSTGADFKAPTLLEGYNYRTPNRREILVPIVKASRWAGVTGGSFIRADGMARMFLQAKVGNGNDDLWVEYIGPATLSGRGGYIPGGGAGDPSLRVPVIYR